MRNLTDIYVRLSDEDRDKRCSTDESESIQNQKSMLINYCIEQGWQINNIYCDEDYSGADRNRPAFNQMIADCEQGKVDIVLCKTQSRFSRDMEIIEKYIHGKFLEWNIRFVSIVDHADTSVVGNKKSRQINGLINEWYLEDLSDNIKRTLHHKKVKGEYCCPYAPYGYKLDPDDKHHFVIDPPAAEVVKSIFDMYRSGMGYMRIAKALNEKKIPPPGVYKSMQGINYRNPNAENAASRQWRDSTIYYIIRQEVYIGSIVQGKSTNVSYKNKKRIKLPKDKWIIVPNMHEPIIDMDTWNDVQHLIYGRGGTDKQFKSRDSGETNPLRGMIFCKECGAGMWRMSYECAKNVRYKYYRCRTVKNSEGVCDNINSIRQVDLEEVILRELRSIIDNYFDPNSIKIEQDINRFNKYELLCSEKSEIEKKIRKIQSESVQLYRDKLKGVINDEQFKMLSTTFNGEIEQFSERLGLIDKEIALCNENQQKRKDKKEILTKYRNVERLTFSLMNELCEGVYVGRLNPKTKEREIEIHWKF